MLIGGVKFLHFLTNLEGWAFRSKVQREGEPDPFQLLGLVHGVPWFHVDLDVSSRLHCCDVTGDPLVQAPAVVLHSLADGNSRCLCGRFLWNPELLCLLLEANRVPEFHIDLDGAVRLNHSHGTVHPPSLRSTVVLQLVTDGVRTRLRHPNSPRVFFLEDPCTRLHIKLDSPTTFHVGHYALNPLACCGAVILDALPLGKVFGWRFCIEWRPQRNSLVHVRLRA
mmetsp:Transcript_44103/g.116666  ORF Transcript_44103/g.116666 Transcript_44103/m.116666 type:complete len:224 (+) Transcript_44103:352-1023(+)